VILPPPAAVLIRSRAKRVAPRSGAAPGNASLPRSKIAAPSRPFGEPGELAPRHHQP
jgi:hypothetical protein